MAIEDIVKSLNKEFGKQVLFSGSDERFKIKRIPTGSYAIDYITGGGIAEGRITEFYGNYSTGKSRLAIKIMAWIQKNRGKAVLYVNVEDTFDERYARRMGLDIQNLVVFRPEVGEDVVNFVYRCLKEDAFGCIVVDSLAALLPAAEANNDAEKDRMGLAGKLTSALMRKLNAGNTNGATIILINQVRDKIGVMWGKKETTPGGRAASFFASQRFELRRGETLKEGKGKDAVAVGRVIHVLLEKDKTGPNEQRSASFHYYFKKMGIDGEQELLDLGRVTGVLRVQRAIIQYAGQTYQGAEKFKEALRQNQDLKKKLWKQIMATREQDTDAGDKRKDKHAIPETGGHSKGAGKPRTGHKGKKHKGN